MFYSNNDNFDAVSGIRNSFEIGTITEKSAGTANKNLQT